MAVLLFIYKTTCKCIMYMAVGEATKHPRVPFVHGQGQMAQTSFFTCIADSVR